MATLQLRRLFSTPVQRLLVRTIVSGVVQPKTQQPHIYKKTYTADELLTYLSDNVVHTCDEYIVTSVPQGIKAFTHEGWDDSERDLVCDTCLHSLIPNLRSHFNCETLVICKSPTRNASGLLVLSKNIDIYNDFRKYLQTASWKFQKIYTYLAVVMGQPVEVVHKTFSVKCLRKDGTMSTQILDESSRTDSGVRKTKYEHRVLESVGDFSLVKVRVSFDARDSVRYILAQKCFSPVFGDSWNVKRSVNTLFGAPLVSDPSCVKPTPFELNPLTLEKLELTPDDQKHIPIHSHLYRMKVSLLNKREFFASVPPPESFTWTCRRLGLNEIEQFAKTTENPL